MCETKTCKICNKNLSIDKFTFVNKAGGKRQYRIRCKECVNQAAKELRNKNEDLTDAYLKGQMKLIKEGRFNSLEEYRAHLLEKRNKVIPEGFLQCYQCKTVFEKRTKKDRWGFCNACACERSKKYLNANREVILKSNRKKQRERIKNADFTYVSQLLKRFAKKYKVEYDELPEEFIGLYIARLKITRALRGTKNED